jgi:hypothetical protein
MDKQTDRLLGRNSVYQHTVERYGCFVDSIEFAGEAGVENHNHATILFYSEVGASAAQSDSSTWNDAGQPSVSQLRSTSGCQYLSMMTARTTINPLTSSW